MRRAAVPGRLAGLDEQATDGSMTGKREAQKAEREQRIFVAACALFAEKGYAATGMDELAERAGLSVGTLYNYYDSKTAVLLAVLAREIEAVTRHGDRIVANPPADPEEGIWQLTSCYFKVMARERDLWRNLWADALAHPAPYEAGLFQLDEVLEGRFATLISHYQRVGAMSRDQPAAICAAAVYGFNSQALMVFLWDRRQTLRKLLAHARAVTKVLIVGLQPRIK